MQNITDPRAGDAGTAVNSSHPTSAASWGAIFAGALVAMSVSLILIALGTGLGFASLSPWQNQGVGAGTFSIVAIIWFIVMQWVSSLFGGYIAGRLRTRWIGTHVHEVFFRDTANGLVTWALATVVVAVTLGSSLSSAIGGGVKAVSAVATAGTAGAAAGSASSIDVGYGIDKLFRAPGSLPAGSGTADESRSEALRIMVNASTEGSLPDADRAYLASLVASRTGMSETDAQRRVDDMVSAANEAKAKAKVAADDARKAAAEVSIYTALAMLIGAFIASISAVLGGRLRDEHI